MTTENTEDITGRIEKLEELAAHQARTIEDLSHSLARQWDEADKMRKKLDALTRRFLDLEEAVGPHPENTPPPHY